MEEILQILERGNGLHLGDSKDVILLIGNTGSGKSTFLRFIGSDNDELISVEVEDGTGEFIIQDENDKIGHGIKSKTILPEKIVDRENNITYIDCPGFNDTRNTAFDIASNYFIKRITDQARSIKLVLLVNYSSVRLGVDRTDFIALIKHVTEFVKDVDKYKNSIALVVSKIDIEYVRTGKDLTLVSNDKVKAKITKYLEKVQVDLEQRLVTESEKHDFYDKALVIIKQIISGNTIAIFRRPDQAGRVSHIQIIHDGKDDIRDTINNKISFVKVASEFGFTISDSSKNSVLSLVDRINEDIIVEITKAKELILQFYYLKITETDSIFVLKEELIKLHSDLLRTINDLEGSTSLKDFNVQIFVFMNSIGMIEDSKIIFHNILQKYNFLNFLQKMMNDKFKVNSLEWAKPLKEVLPYILEYKIWYSFLLIVYEKLSSYRLYVYFQKNINKFIDEDSEDLVLNTVQLTSFMDFLKNCDGNDFEQIDFEKIDNFNVDDVKLKDLIMVLKAILSINEYNRVGPDKLQITGHYIKLSDVSKILHSYTGTQTIEIFALVSLFIDADLVQKGKNIFIIAPKWEIIGERKIVLDGEPGRAHVHSKAAEGENGKPGLPGGASGNFMGVSQAIINGELLTISANGGRGGNGQDGGNGIPGEDASLNEQPKGSRENGERIMSKSGYDRTQCNQKWAFEDFFVIVGFANYEKTYKYLLKSRPGKTGGTGGMGGEGGYGGPAGNIFVDVANKNNIKMSNYDGNRGKSGEGGEGGIGGKNSNEINCEFKIIDKYFFWYRIEHGIGQWRSYSLQLDIRRADSGFKPGRKSITGIQKTETKIPFESPSYTINSFKTFILKNLSDHVRKHSLENFYFYLNQNYIDSLGLLNELEVLEKFYHSSNGKIQLGKFYESLLYRIVQYSTTPKPDETTNCHILLLAWLYTATLTRIQSMKQHLEINTIINFETHFTLMIKNFKKAQKSLRDFVINQYNINYEAKIDSKINETKCLIQKHIIPNINELLAMHKSKIEDLVSEIISLKDDSGSKKNNLLIKKQNELKLFMSQKYIYDKFKSNCALLYVISNIGAIVSNVIQSSGHISSLIEEGVNIIKNSLNSKRLALIHFIDLVLKETEKFPKAFDVFLKEIRKIQTVLTGTHGNINQVKITEITGTLKQEFKKQIMDSHKKTPQTKKIVNENQRFRIFEKVLYMLEHFTEDYLKFKDDKSKIDSIIEAIQIQDNHLNYLYQYETHMNETLIPMFQTMQDDIQNYQRDLSTKSRGALNISRWKIQDSFKEIKKTIRQFSKDLILEEDFKCVVDKLDDAMSTLFNMYDCIQNYNEQKELADYNHNIISHSSEYPQIENKEIKNALVRLEFIIKSNVALKQFQMAMSNLKQFIFPFAVYYKELFDIPPQMFLENNLENLVSTACMKIEYLKNKFLENSSTLKSSFDRHIYEEHFSGGTLVGPFFTWDGDTCERSISKMLSGEEVILKSDITRSNPDKYSIKFNVIQIYLRAESGKINKELESKLKFFDVTMKHYGNSYYRFNNSFYMISSDSQTFNYSFEKDIHQEPVRKNDVYNKIKNGNYMLSPYATWSFQLKSIANASFKELDEFRGKVDLELIGHGQYVSPDINIKCEDLKEFYNTVEYMSVPDTLDEN